MRMMPAFRRLILLSTKLHSTGLTRKISLHCHACLARRHRASVFCNFRQNLVKAHPISTSCIMKNSDTFDQHEAVRTLLSDLLTSKENGKGSGKPGIMSETQVRQVCSHYRQLNDSTKVNFLLALSQLCGTDHKAVMRAAKNLESAQEKGASMVLQSEQRLAHSLMPGYKLLFTYIGRLDGGVKFLVDMRADIINFQHLQPNLSSDAHMRALNATLKDMLAHWFSAGLLQLQTITWQSSCEMLQKISEYEAVHPVRSWADIKRRVGPYRRCFVYTHSSMPQEPVVVLHTALTDRIPASIQTIVGERREQTSDSPLALEQPEDPEHIKAAIFYSISSTQKGLRGIDLGNYLIKGAVRTLQADFPQLDVFSSLSPIPGFRSWLLAEINRQHRGESSTNLFMSDELHNVHSLSGRSDQSELATVRRLLSTNQWAQSEKLVSSLERPLMRLCARYLFSEKHRGFALDSVANFHLRNGAVMWRLNWMGDTSPRGLTSSCGIMVNYRYFLESTLTNSQAYGTDHTISATQQILSLVEEATHVGHKSNL